MRSQSPVSFVPVSRYQSQRTYFWSSKSTATVSETANAASDAKVAPADALDSTATSALPPSHILSSGAPPSTVTDATTTAAEVATAFADSPIVGLTKIGDLKELGFCNWTPAGLAERLLEFMYLTTGLPWWGTIICTTLLIRLAVLPLIIKVSRSTAKIQNLKPVTQPIQEALSRAKASGDRMEAMKQQKKMMAVFKDNKVSPLAPVLGLAQAPIFLSFFWALKGMANFPVPGFSTGGFGWVTDLTVADPYYILPLAASIGTLIVLETGAESGGAKMAGSSMMKPIMRIGIFAVLPITSSLPAAIFIYWMTSNVFTFFQLLLLKQPAVRKFFNIPMLNKDALSAPINATSRMSFQESYKKLKEAAKEREAAAARALAAKERIREAAGQAKA
ncbi:Mitochondrial inner membrane protein oxa1l [Borealophlyctis nickersoniae]|nr:Mitochondrial inner membrane protein oxa1l [Borealophlyctis nickersoniae]